MNILTREQLLEKKTSDTIFVLGSGASIKYINPNCWSRIGGVNSIGFNWFCHHQFGPSFFLIREQANTKARNKDGETVEALLKDLSKPSYASTTLFVHDVSHAKKARSYSREIDKFSQDGVIVRDVPSKPTVSRMKYDILDRGVCHGKCTLTNVLHICLWMKYKTIAFVGVDLYDSRYFWLGRKSVRRNISTKGLSQRSTHPVTGHVLNLVRMIKSNFKVNLFTTNSKSLLTQQIPFKRIEELC